MQRRPRRKDALILGLRVQGEIQAFASEAYRSCTDHEGVVRINYEDL